MMSPEVRVPKLGQVEFLRSSERVLGNAATTKVVNAERFDGIWPCLDQIPRPGLVDEPERRYQDHCFMAPSDLDTAATVHCPDQSAELAVWDARALPWIWFMNEPVGESFCSFCLLVGQRRQQLSAYGPRYGRQTSAMCHLWHPGEKECSCLVGGESSEVRLEAIDKFDSPSCPLRCVNRNARLGQHCYVAQDRPFSYLEVVGELKCCELAPPLEEQQHVKGSGSAHLTKSSEPDSRCQGLLVCMTIRDDTEGAGTSEDPWELTRPPR